MFRTPHTFFQESFNLCPASLAPSSRGGEGRVAIFLNGLRCFQLDWKEVAGKLSFAQGSVFALSLCRFIYATSVHFHSRAEYCGVFASDKSSAKTPPRRGRFPHLFSSFFRPSMFLIRASKRCRCSGGAAAEGDCI